jgi:hypothetical protein
MAERTGGRERESLSPVILLTYQKEKELTSEGRVKGDKPWDRTNAFLGFI